MTDLSDIVPGRAGEGRVAYVEDTAYDSIDAVVAAFPALTSAEGALHLAKLVSHFARGDLFAVIDDPAAFEAGYKARLASEDPTPQPYEQNVIRLSDFGEPDYGALTPPKIEAGALVFFARDAATGLPYQVRAALAALGAPAFNPVPLTPLDDPSAEQDAEPTRSRMSELIESIAPEAEPDGDRDEDADEDGDAMGDLPPYPKLDD